MILIIKSFEMCLHIGQRKADLEILKFKVILHDIGRNEEDKTSGKLITRYGAELAKMQNIN